MNSADSDEKLRIILQSEDKESVITLDVMSFNDSHLPSVQLAVSVQDKGFTGINHTIYIDRDELRDFLAACSTFDKTLHGQVTLRSMSPEELIITIENIDEWGHLALKYRIGRFSYVGLATVWHSVSGGFPFELTEISSFIKGLTHIMRQFEQS